MTRLAVILAVVSALCLGVAAGFLGGVVVSHHLMGGGSPFLPGSGFGRHGPRMMREGPGGPGGMPSPRAATAHLQRVLDLTPAQADAIRDEIERTRGNFAQVRDSLHARIERHLTPAQRERWRSMVRERHPDDFELHGHPDGPDPEGEQRR